MDQRLLTETEKLKKLMNYRVGTQPEVLEEGYKDWLMGATLLATAIMSPSKASSQINKLTPEKAQTTIQSIKNIITDTTKLRQVANYLNTNGYPGSSQSIKNRVVDKGNEMIKRLKQVKNSSDATMDVVSTENPIEAKKLFSSGYVFTKAEIKELVDTVYADVDEIPVTKTSVNGFADDFFNFGDITLKDNIKHEIDSVIEDIISNGRIITNIRIISGTDFVRVIPGGSLDSMGIHDNNQLATARANTIKDYIATTIPDTSLFTTCVFPNNIANKSGYQPDEKLRIAGVEIISIEKPIAPTQPAADVNLKTSGEFELVKIKADHSTIKHPSGKGNLRKTITKSIKKSDIGRDLPCPKFDIPTFQ